MKAKSAKKLKTLLDSGKVRVTSKDELNAVYGDPGAASDAELGMSLPKMGRPRADAKTIPTIGKTVKHTEAFWKEMMKKANKRGLTLHEAMREALAKWMKAA